jgi:hypothetical protein
MSAFNPSKTWWFSLTNSSTSQHRATTAPKGARLVVLLWITLSLAWLSQDLLLRDGDEEGHVGAAELFLSDLNSGEWLGFFERLFIGPMGEYPQAFTAGVGAWWWAIGEGLPGTLTVRAICLVSLLATGLATGRIARRLVHASNAGRAEIFALVGVLCLPLGNGLTRHFMPEGALMAAVSLSILAMFRWVERPNLSRAVQLGAVVGMGLMTKQTFILGAALPLIWVGRRLGRSVWRRVLPAVLTAAAIAGPWIVSNLSNQMKYSTESIAGNGGGELLAHLGFYPLAVLKSGLGPPLALAFLLAAFSLWRSGDRRALLPTLIWFVGGMLILLLIPKKYPRLMAPLLPGAVLCIAAAMVKVQIQSRWIAVSAALSIPWVILTSVWKAPTHTRNPEVDRGCPQVWMRPPIASSVGLAETAQALSTQPDGDVLVTHDPEIPCSLQTTHNWSTHLGPYLRRVGAERTVHIDPNLPHRFVLAWAKEGGEIHVEPLSLGLNIRDTITP